MTITISGTSGVTYPAGGTDNVAGAGVGTTDTQTLTNKTLTSPTLNTATINSFTAPNLTEQSTVGFKNRIINGAMMIDQRNAHGSFTVGTNSVVYEADRWFIYSGGGQTFGNTNADTSLSGFSYSMTIQPQTGATNVSFNQRIESYNIADCAGQNVTLSFWIYTSGLSGTSSYVQPYTPTAQDNYSSGTYGSAQTISYTNGSWVKNTFTFSTSNGGMNANYGLGILFNFASAVGATIKITGVQLEKGSTATSFDYRPYGTELALCQRYYEKSYETNTPPGTATATGMMLFPTADQATNQFVGNSQTYRVEKRAAATMSFWDVAGNLSRSSLYSAGGLVRTDNNNNVNTIVGGTSDLYIIVSAAAGNFPALQWTASAEL